MDWKSKDKRSEVYFAIQTGRQREVITTADSNVTVYSLILNQDFGQHWHYQLEHDLLVSDSRTGNTVDDFETLFDRELSVLHDQSSLASGTATRVAP